MRRRALLLALVTAACGSSPPTRFYALQPVPPPAGAGEPGPATSSPALAVQVLDVSVPPALDRLSYVRDLGGGRLDISDVSRWAAPLQDSIQDVLSADLRSRLRRATVLAPGSPRPADARLISVVITRFMADQGGLVTLEGDWTLLLSRSRKILLRRHERLTEQAASSDASAVTPVMSTLLARLADRIAGAL